MYGCSFAYQEEFSISHIDGLGHNPFILHLAITLPGYATFQPSLDSTVGLEADRSG